jgi:hypothetical protein
VAFLANAVRSGVAEARPLLDGGLAWLLAQDTGDRAGHAFPSLLPVGMDPVPARVAWCYGDPGVAAALAQAARALGDDALRARARDVALGCGLRDEPGVVDSGICHGAAGLAHTFHRLGAALADDDVLALARHWALRTLDFRQPPEEGGRFLTWIPLEGAYQTWTTLLEGSCGVGLVLLSALTGETWWDGLLLLDGGSR